MDSTWKDQLYTQRVQLAQILQTPITHTAQQLIYLWPDRQRMEEKLLELFSHIPYCTSLYILNPDGIQICDNISDTGIETGHYLRDRSQRPYMKEVVPAWGFLLSDAYISEIRHQPCLTALQILRTESELLGYLGADFSLRNLPASPELYKEPESWRQVKGDPAIRDQLFLQTRADSPMDRSITQTMSILEEMISQRGIFQAQIHFSSSQAIIWLTSDPLRYRILDIEALTDPDICLLFPRLPYPEDSTIPKESITSILETFVNLRYTDENIYLRAGSINIYNGMVSLTFSCDGSHYMPYDEFLLKNTEFWFGAAA
jgi:hypothetical protein